MSERWFASLISLAVLVAVVYPIAWREGRDSFPLSSYPMFARNRRSPVLHATYVVATTDDGARRFVPPELVANREVLQARAVLDQARRGGKRAALDLCRRISRRVARQDSGFFARAQTIAIVSASHDAVHYFERGELGVERELAKCGVPGR